MKKHPEDIVWNTITASARAKFDHKAFRKEFGPFDNDRIMDTILFQILEGFAEQQPVEWIANNISHDLQMLSYPFAKQDFKPFVTNHEELFTQEIKATALALDLFSARKEIPVILKEIENFLLAGTT